MNNHEQVVPILYELAFLMNELFYFNLLSYHQRPFEPKHLISYV